MYILPKFKPRLEDAILLYEIRENQIVSRPLRKYIAAAGLHLFPFETTSLDTSVNTSSRRRCYLCTENNIFSRENSLTCLFFRVNFTNLFFFY